MRTLTVSLGAALGAALALSGLIALAQEPAAPDPNQPLEAATPGPLPAPGDVDPTRPLDEYEASEQISEDLSVAFPVDI